MEVNKASSRETSEDIGSRGLMLRSSVKWSYLAQLREQQADAAKLDAAIATNLKELGYGK